MKPIYEMAVMNVRKMNPGAQDTRVVSGDARFRDSLRSTLWEDYGYLVHESELTDCKESFDELWEQTFKPKFIPDLWHIDAKEHVIHLFEIEDTHPLQNDKIALIHNYWWDMDAYGWEVRLIVFDRYGLNPRPLDLTDYAFHMIGVLRREKRDA